MLTSVPWCLRRALTRPWWPLSAAATKAVQPSGVLVLISTSWDSSKAVTIWVSKWRRQMKISKRCNLSVTKTASYNQRSLSILVHLVHIFSRLNKLFYLKKIKLISGKIKDVSLQPALSFCFLLLHKEYSHQLPLQEWICFLQRNIIIFLKKLIIF